MRPVTRGDSPRCEAGDEREFAHYHDARDDLEARLGAYCSYCELPLQHSPHVEHVQPKSCHPELATRWENLLLACGHCNSCKGSEDVALGDYLWPDRDNTAWAFGYDSGGNVNVRAGLTPAGNDRATRTIDLLGLTNRPTVSDRRRRWRRHAWDVALRAKGNLAANGGEALRRQVRDTALGHGFFSVWMTVFRDDADMCRRFIEAFPGTADGCFDESGVPKPSIERRGVGA
jgi:uncharacterized protein (TIGR02646 family)